MKWYNNLINKYFKIVCKFKGHHYKEFKGLGYMCQRCSNLIQKSTTQKSNGCCSSLGLCSIQKKKR